MAAPDALANAQAAFAEALQSAKGEEVATRFLAGDAERNRALLALYRGNVVANHTGAMTNSFPVLRQVVGEEFFDGLARAYRRERPSRGGNLDEAGEDFASFLAGFEPARELPYLADLAALEWAVARAWRAADAASVASEWLSGFDMESLAAARPSLQPAFQVLGSECPIVQIWRQHQAFHEGGLAIRLEEAECACVWRDAQGVGVAAITPAERAFWLSLGAGETIGAALQVAVQTDSNFDFAACLGFALQHGLICHA